MELVSIGYTLLFSLPLCLLIVCAFGVSAKLGSNLVAPRTSNRPREAQLLGGGDGFFELTFGWVRAVMG